MTYAISAESHVHLPLRLAIGIISGLAWISPLFDPRNDRDDEEDDQNTASWIGLASVDKVSLVQSQATWGSWNSFPMRLKRTVAAVPTVCIVVCSAPCKRIAALSV